MKLHLSGDTLFSVDCGGGHRDWSFMPGNNATLLAFVKEGALNIATVRAAFMINL